MKKALVILEPRNEPYISYILRRASSFRNFVEINFWLMPLIRRLRKNCKVSIISAENTFVEELAKKTNISFIQGKISKSSMDYAFKESIRLVKKLQLYGELSELLRIEGVSIGEALDDSARPWLNLFKQIELASNVLDEANPNIVYIESALYPLGRAFEIVCVKRGVEYSFLQPTSYRKLKTKIRAYLSFRGKTKNYLSNALYRISRVGDIPSQGTIIVDAHYINYFNAVYPIIKKVLDRHYECYIYGKESFLSSRFKGIKKINIECQGTTEYKKKAEMLKAYYHSKLENDVQFQSLFRYRGINLWDVMKVDIRSLFDYLSKVISSLDYFFQMIDKIKPDIMVIGSESKTTFSIASHVALAKKRDIPVLEIQHGIFAEHYYYYINPISDKIAVGGDYWKKLFLAKLGGADVQIVVTGWPKFDIYSRLKNDFAKQGKDKANILLITQPLDVKLNLDIIESIGSFIRDSPNLRLVVKPHPAENAKTYRQMAEKYKQVILHDSREDISTLIASSDVVLLVMSSTVGTEATLLDKPIICINRNVTNEETKPLYVLSRIAIEVKNLKELIPAIKDALYNEEVRETLAEARKKFVYGHAYIQDGKASERVVNLIEEMTKESKRNRNERVA